MGISGVRYWAPSLVGALASGVFLALHVGEPWIVAGEPAPILVPCLVSTVIFLACAADAVIMYLRARPERSGEEGKPDVVRLAWYLGSLLAFAVLLKPLGFIPVVVVVFPMLLRFGERVSLRRAVLTTVITGIVVYVIFDRLLAVDLPHGTLLATWL